MTEIGSMVLDITARIKGYQQEINKIKTALKEVGDKTDLGKGLKKDLSFVEKRIEAIGKHLNIRINTEGQLTKFNDSLNEVDTTLLRIGQNMQKVTFEDIDTSKVEQALQGLITKEQELTRTLTTSLDTDFTEIIAKKLESGRLKNIFENLKIDPSQLNYENFAQVFEDALERTKAKAEELKNTIQELQTIQQQANQEAAQFGQVASLDTTQLINQLRDAFPQSQMFSVSKEAVENLEKGFEQYFADMKVPESTIENKIKPIFERLTLSENTSQLEHNLRNLSADISKALGKGFSKDKIEASLSHIMDGQSWSRIINFDKFKEIDTSKLDIVRVALEDFFKNINGMANDQQINEIINNILESFSKNGPSAAITAATEALKGYINEAERAKQIKLDEATAAGQQITESKTALSETYKDATSLRTHESDLATKYQELLQKYEDVQRQLNELRAEINQRRDAPAGQVRGSGVEISKEAEDQLKASAIAASEYTSQLNAAKDAEKLVGKVEGVAQRWFSVYAVVRMVTNAINNMKKVIAELDKTITEIAIVTNMSQGDLWGQMGTYTAMAHEYAASIQGVYQVSQLYYQQGLQTAEVMALTESTLKMARISGLDYAEATDYMTNAVRSFKMEMEDAENVVNVYSAIAAKSATNVKELAIAMSKTASSAESVGSSFENTTAMMAVMIESTREAAQNIGSAMKSIISRYGEMKADPTKLIDSEGEALSLNKVDTALQSVGITIHDAEGKFRDFDDVIEELAKSWDTIDINTQRYIATVMAGNRQQSRFLALVSNYNRYKELSATAADSENAAQLQFLKTLDSVQAKQQQLQTNIQSLYTSSGIQNLYKGILDISNAIVNSFSQMPTLFNLPIAAITKFASLFYSLASVVKSVFAIIYNEATIQRIKYNNLLQQEVNEKVKTEQEKTNAVKDALAQQQKMRQDAANAEANLDQTTVTNKMSTEQAKAQAVANGSLRNTGTLGVTLFGKKVPGGTLGLNMASLGLSALGSSLKNTKNMGAQRAGGAASTLGTALSGAALGSAIPGIGTAVGFVAGGALGFIQNYKSIIQDTETQLNTLSEIAEASKNKALQSQAETKSLQNSIEKLKELEKARYSSIEAEQKYLEATNTLASQYPELISAYAKTGEAIISVKDANVLLQQSLEKTVSTLQQSAKDNYNKAKKQKQKEVVEEAPADDAFLAAWVGEQNKANEIFRRLLDQQGYDEAINLFGTNLNSEALLEQIQTDKVKKLVSSFLTGDLVNDYSKLSRETIRLLNDETIDGVEKQILQSIADIYESTQTVITRQLKINNKLGMVGRSGATQIVNSVIALNQTEDDILNKVASSNEVINAMILNKWSDYNGDYDKYVAEIPDLVKEAQGTLRDVINTIGVDAFNEIANYRTTVSATAFDEYIDEKNFNDNVKQALKNYFENAYNIEDFKDNLINIKNTEIKDALENFSNNTGEKLSGLELQSISDQANTIIKLIDSGKLTQSQGSNFLKQYLSVWSSLEEKLDSTQREAAELLLQTWDGSRSGLEGILTSLKNNGVDESNEAYQAVKNLIPYISENLNTMMTTLSSSIATSVKSLDDAIKDLSKGVTIDKAVEYAEKLGVDLNKFELDYSTGLWKYNDLNQIQQKYFENIDTQISNAKTMLQQYTNNSQDIKQLLKLTPNAREKSTYGSQLYDKLGEAGLDKIEVNSIITAFEATGKEVSEFDSWLAEHYEQEFKMLYEARTNAEARAALSLGDISGFVESIAGEDSALTQFIRDSIIANGKINIDDIKSRIEQSGRNLPVWLEQLLIQYTIAVSNVFKDSTKNIYDSAIKSITEGPQQIQINESNYETLSKLTGKQFSREDADSYAILDWSDTDITNYRNRVTEILNSGLKPEEIDAQLDALEKAVYNNDVSDAFNEVISKYNGFSVSAANKLARALGIDIEQLGATFNEITGEYSIGLQELRALVINSTRMTLKERNDALAKIDKQARETSVQNTFSDLVKNANNLTEENLQKFADSLGISYQTLAVLWKQKDGTYKVDLRRLSVMKKSLQKAGNKFAAGILDSIIDEYIEQLSNISDKQTSGFTNLSDMRKYADMFSEGSLEIYRWDNELKAYVLNQQGIVDQVTKARQELAYLDQNSDEYKIASKLLEANGKKLAERINFSELAGSVGTNEYTKNALNFIQAVKDYNAYLEGLGKATGLINAQEYLKNAQKGGLTAVRSAQYLAATLGQELTAQDIETIYRGKVQTLIDATEQINLTVGAMIDKTAAEILNEIPNFKAVYVGQGKYVITSVGKLVDAQKAIYDQIKNSNEATLAEINAQYVKLKNLESKSSEMEALTSSAEMTYETLGTLLADMGIRLEDFLAEYSNSLIQELGGGKIKITNFEFFATQILGITDTTSKAYIDAFRQYNDSIINNMQSNISNEINNVANANKNDKINLTSIYSGLGPVLSKQLSDELSQIGAGLNNGILDMAEADKGRVLAIIKNYINKSNIKDKELELEKIDEQLYTYVDNSITTALDALKNQSTGYTNISEMTKIADNLHSTVDEIFKWDDTLKTYIMTQKGIQQSILKARHDMELLDKNSAQYKAAAKTLEAIGKELASKIDFVGLVGSVGTEEYEKASSEFTQAIKDYNAYLGASGKDIQLNTWRLKKAALKGGYEAAAAAQTIAKVTGQKVSGSDIETIYRSGAEKINSALSQVELSIGSVIDESTVKLLGISDKVENLGSGKAVITSSIDVVEAYQKIYQAMMQNNGTTLSELNALEVKILTQGQNKSLNAANALGGIADISYATLASIAEELGKDVYTLLDDLGDTVEDLGNGNVRINNFAKFVNITGIEKGTEAYVDAYISFNDAIISSQNKNRDNLLNATKAISEAHAGDQVNVAALTANLSDDTIYAINDAISKYGGRIKNGILSLGKNANIAAITKIILDAAEATGELAEREVAEIKDAIQELFDNILSAIQNGLKGTLKNVDKLDLQESLKNNYGIELGDADFTKTAEGFKLTQEAAMRVYNEIKSKNAELGTSMLSELTEFLEKSNDDYKTMGGLMNHIAELQKKINDPEVSDARRQKYQEELDIAKEIAEVRATTDSSSQFDFMNNKMPGAMQNPITYAENWGKALNILKKGSGDRKGFVNAQDWYNIVNEMNNIAGMGQKIKMYGVELDGSLEAASELIQRGFNHMSAVDGGKLEVNLSKLGKSFEAGAMDMKGDITKGIHAMAKSQIQMLDGLIAVLETVVAMEDAFKGVAAADDGKIEFDELFENLTPTEDLNKVASQLLAKFPNLKDPNNPLNQIVINGQKMSDLLKQATTNTKMSESDAKALYAAIKGFYEASLSGNYDTNNITESVKQVLQQSGLMDGDLAIDIGTTTIYLTGNVLTQIDWGSDDVKTAIEKAFGTKNSSDGKTPEQQAREAMSTFAKNPKELLKDENGAAMKFVLSVNSEVTYDEKTQTYIVDGNECKTPEDAYKALMLKSESELAKLTFDKEGKLTGATIEGEEGVKVELNIDSEGNIEYTYTGPTGETSRGDTAENAIRAYYMAHPKLLPEDMSLDDVVHRESVRLGLSASTGITFEKDEKGKTKKPTLEDTQKAQEILNNPAIKTYEDLATAAKTAELPITIDTGLEGDLSAEDLKKFAEMFGIDYKIESKNVSLNVSVADGVPNPLQEILNNGKLTAEVELTLTGDTSTDSNPNGTGGIGDLLTGKKAKALVGISGIKLFNANEGDENSEGLSVEVEEGVLPKEVNTGKSLIAQALISAVKFISNALSDGDISTTADSFIPDNVKTAKAIDIIATLGGVIIRQATSGLLGMFGNSLTASGDSEIPDDVNSPTPIGLIAGLAGVTLTKGVGGLLSTLLGGIPLVSGDSYIPDIVGTMATIALQAIMGNIFFKEGGDPKLDPTETAKLPDDADSNKTIKIKASAGDIVISTGDAATDEAVKAYINDKINKCAAALIPDAATGDSKKNVKLKVGLDSIFTDSTIDLSSIELPETLQNQLNAANDGTGDPFATIAFKILLSSIFADFGDGESAGEAAGEATAEAAAEAAGAANEESIISTVDWPPIVDEILSSEKIDAGDKYTLLLGLSAINANLANQGIQVDWKNVTIPGYKAGNADKGTSGSLTYDDALTLLLKIGSINPVNEAAEPNYAEAVGIYKETITLGEMTFIIPYKVSFTPGNDGSLPTEKSFDFDTTLSNNDDYGSLILAQKDNVKDYLNKIKEHKAKGGKFTTQTKDNYDKLKNFLDAHDFDDQYKDLLSIIKEIDNIDTDGITDSKTALEELGESPALQDPKTGQNLQLIGEGIIKCCQIDVGHLQQFYHILEDLPKAANTFVNDANWQEVVKIFAQLEKIKGEAAEGIGGEEGEKGEEESSISTIKLAVELIASDYILQLLEGGQIERNLLLNITPGLTGSTTTNPNAPVPPTPAQSATPTQPAVSSNPLADNAAATADEVGRQADEALKTADKAGEVVEASAESVESMTESFHIIIGQASNMESETDGLVAVYALLFDAQSSAASSAELVADAVDRIPAKTSINIDAHFDLGVDVKITKTIETIHTSSTAKGTATSSADVDFDFHPGAITLQQADFTISKAKGSKNLALPTGTTSTLMGELGPELFVTNGHYYVAGQHGAEFVDLPKDAIVFNHQKTESLLKNKKVNGRGKPFTNETNAISFATGTPMGPAMASASQALAALKQLRAIWASMLKASAKQLGSQAGRGGGGGKDDNNDDKYKQPTTTTADIQRWYNWLRQIDKIEKDITYQEKLQKKYESDKVANGEKIFATQKERLKLLDQEIQRNERLAELQKSWYDRKREELANSSYGKIFTYDENGLQQYVGSGRPGSGLGLDILEQLTRRTVQGQAIDNATNAKTQLRYLASVGFDLNDLIYNDDGTKVVKEINQRSLRLKRMGDTDESTTDEELYTKLMENFWDRVDGWRDELDSLYDSYQDQLAKIEENSAKQNEILQGFVKNELDVEEKLLSAVEAREQAIIDKLQEEKDALEKSTQRFIKGVQDALDKEKQAQERNDAQEELTKLQRQLAILQRSGGSDSQIKSLQDQIETKQQELYYQGRQDEIDAVQEAADKQLEKLDKQIELLTDTLEYQKKNGLLWNEVRELMEQPVEVATDFYNQWIISRAGQSALKQEEDLREFKESFQEWKAYDEDKEQQKLAKEEMEAIANSETYGEQNQAYLAGITDENERKTAITSAENAANEAREAYLKENPEDEEGARKAAEKAYNASLRSSYVNSSDNKEANATFNESYQSWLQNRRLADSEDFTNSDLFNNNEAVFREAMQSYYLEHQDEENVWENALKAGRAALEEQLLHTNESTDELFKGAIIDTAPEFGMGGKTFRRLDKKAYAVGDEYEFDDIKIDKKGKKYIHVKTAGSKDRGWIPIEYVAGGNRIYNDLEASQRIKPGDEESYDATLPDTIEGVGGNGYYGEGGRKSTLTLTGLKKGAIKFPASNMALKDGGSLTLDKTNNTIEISDVEGLVIKNGKVSKLGKITVNKANGKELANPVKIKSSAAIKSQLNKLILDPAELNILKYMNAYAAGGMNYTTGPAWLDGTKSKPEAVLNASQTSFLKNDLLGNQSNSLKSIVLALQDSIGNTVNSNTTTSSDNLVIENIAVTFESGVISSDYDMRRASELFKDELVKIARKSGNRSVSRR